MESTPEGLSLRPMKLKILYTFDTENKNNCLARPPGIVDVYTATLEDTTEIGVIDLKTCTTAIAQASPELIGSNTNDYTIYAYDYSEPDTPLAGQGMLSWALASPGGFSEDMHAGKMITGRVTRNVLGLFSRNATETLEVKLRLTPVPGKTQGEYLDGLQRYQEMSNMIGQDFDAQAWTSFLQTNPIITAPMSRFQAQPQPASPLDSSGLENVQRILSGDHTSGNRSRPASRSGTPTTQIQNVSVERQGPTHSRPGSRASLRGSSMPIAQGPQQRRDSFSSGYVSGDDVFEEEPAKKRAKLTTTKWQGNPNFNIERQPDSLRVAASTAASVRLHRPVPYNPTIPAQEPVETGNEESGRPPTPIPVGGRAPMRRAATISSGLRRESMVRSSSPYMPPPELVMEQSSNGSGYSPERRSEPSVSSTPVNMPSSPPVITGQTSTNSSPVLPPLHKDNDSGFMSGAFDDLFDDGTTMNFNDDLSQLPNLDLGAMNNDEAFLGNGTARGGQARQQHNLQHQTRAAEIQPSAIPRARSSESISNQSVREADQSLQTPETGQQNLNPAPISSQSAPKVPPIRPATRAGFHSPRLAPAPVPRARQMQEEMRSNLPKGGRLASDPVGPILQRSQTWTGGMSELLQSDASVQLDSANKANIERKRKPGKEQTQARLDAAVKTGQIPPICDNCGTIDTPCWRKAWSKLFGGGYDLMEVSNKVGQFVGKEVIERDEKGEVKLFRAYKLQKGTGDKDCDFEPVNLCNSCGLWLQKRQCMRPETRWNKNSKDPNDKGKKPSRPRSQRTAARKGKKGDTSKSDAPTEPASSPPDEGSDGAQMSEAEETGRPNDAQKANGKDADDHDEPTLPPMVPPSRSVKSESNTSIAMESAKAAAHREVKSSPIRPPGSDVNGPIEIDLTPKPLRRQLFSSPTRPATAGHHFEQTVLAEISPNIVRRSPRLNKTRHISGLATKTPSPDSKTQAHTKKTPLKQNQHADDLDDLFQASDNDENSFSLPPQTPTPSRRSNRLLSKTPSKTPTNQKKVDPAMTPSQNRLLNILRTPKGKAQLSQHPTASALLGQATNNIEEMTPFTRQIHDILTDPAISSEFTPAPQAKKPTSGNNSNRTTIPALDFPDLPSLQGSSPNQATSASGGIHVDFSEFTHLNSDGADPMNGVDLNELISTDVPMPSSPPLTMNMNMNMTVGALMDPWEDLGDSTQQQQQHGQKRISPRRRKDHNNGNGNAHEEGEFDSGIGMLDESQFSMDIGMEDMDMDFQSLIDQAFAGQR
ncbi:MAG: hypothetical protein Q9160_007194 [Pyrenula sp. 1 TL-2023]